MTPVTAWYRLNERDELEFNHLEYKRLPRDATHPTPKTEEHKRTWAKGVWIPFNAMLTAEFPPKLI